MSLSFKQILVPFDGSEQSIVALKSAVFFSQKYDAQLNVVHIEEIYPNDQIEKILTMHAQGAPYKYMRKDGKPFKGIIEASKEINADLIVMGTHGVSGFEEFWMGSNAHKVVNLSKCPVLTMRENEIPNNFKKIVLPIDTSFESRQKIPLAVNLAQKFGATIHLLGVSVDKDKESEHLINTYTRQAINNIEENNVTYTLEKKLGENITNLTIDYAKSIDADLIVIMTEQEPQLGSFFLGKFAQQMINHSTIPVFSIMPREDLMVTDARL